MEGQSGRSLTEADKDIIFRKATATFAKRYASHFVAGMRDDDLAEALKDSLGIFGGSGGPGGPSIAYTGSGLRIWGGWNVINHVQEKPVFEGAATIARAREVYGIVNPDDPQLQLF